jgi:hypothetical protein
LSIGVQKTDPFDGAETGGDAEVDMSIAGLGGPRVGNGRLCAVPEAPILVAGLDDVTVV